MQAEDGLVAIEKYEAAVARGEVTLSNNPL
jgi:hypothetical protein